MVKNSKYVNKEKDLIQEDKIHGGVVHEDEGYEDLRQKDGILENAHFEEDTLQQEENNLNDFLVNFKNFKSPEDILLNLSILSQSNLESLYFDDLIVYSFHILKHNHLKEFLDLLYDLFIGMRDPRNIVIPLFNYQKENSLSSLLILKVIFFVIQNYDFQFNEFYKSVYDSISLINLENDTNEKLIFIINLLFNNNSVNVKFMKSVVKKLMSITLEGSSKLSLKIIYSVLNILRCNPVLFEMALNENDDFDIYKELEILSFSIKEISILTNQIKKEAKSKEMRMKFINLSNLKFPEIKI